VHEELRGFGFTVITVALDKDADSARPWIERANPTHPSLIDSAYVLADAYNIVNVPTVLRIDEHGMIVRPNDIGYATDTYRGITGIDSARFLDGVRAWVRGETPPPGGDAVRTLQALPDEQHQLARAEFGLARWLLAAGRTEAAERHFVRAGELAPHDFTIRRGSLPMRGIDSMGPVFFDMVRDWITSGHTYYTPLPPEELEPEATLPGAAADGGARAPLPERDPTPPAAAG
jgi:hypothetical protein